MHIGVCTIALYLPQAHSLKEKRRVVKSLKDRLHRQFNVSVAEVACQNQHQHAELGIACVATDTKQANAVLSSVVRFVEQAHPSEFRDYTIEIL